MILFNLYYLCINIILIHCFLTKLVFHELFEILLIYLLGYSIPSIVYTLYLFCLFWCWRLDLETFYTLDKASNIELHLSSLCILYDVGYCLLGAFCVPVCLCCLFWFWFVLHQGPSIEPWMSCNLLCRPGWALNSHRFASAAWMLGLKVCSIMSGLYILSFFLKKKYLF